MIYVVERLLQDFERHAQTCELEICYEDKLCKVKRMDYLPDDEGKLYFRKESSWVNDGYTIQEAVEFLKKYKEDITELLFEAYDGSFQPFVNTFEVKGDTSGVIYRLRILVGVAGEPLVITDNMLMPNQIPIVRIL